MGDFMEKFNNNQYDIEVEEKWGNSPAYYEYVEKTKNYSNDNKNKLAEEMNSIMSRFSTFLLNDYKPANNEVQSLVKVLQNHITQNYYTCTNEILYCLGQMYVADVRFKDNIDKNVKGTAEFVLSAIKIYCK